MLLSFGIILVSWQLGLAASNPQAEVSSANLVQLEPIQKNDRILILAPHPDDETIGCAGVIQSAVAAGADVHVAYFTNGDHNEPAFIVYEKRLTFRSTEFIHMGEVRRQEAIAAMKLLGVPEANLVFLGYPDFGTFNIFTNHWQDAKPYKSFLTRISAVPYKENLSFAAPYKGESILKDLKKVLLDYQPNKIFVSHPVDVNVDHKTLYLFLEVALADLKGEIPQPKLYPYLVHYVGWPLPRRYHPELSLLPPKQFTESQLQWSSYALTPAQLKKKHQAILCYKSQTQSSAFYLFSFARKNELFGYYPEVTFSLPAAQNNNKAPQLPSFVKKTLVFLGLSKMFPDSGVTATLSKLQDITKPRGQVDYSLSEDSLVIRIAKNEDLNRRFSSLLYLFGYSNNVAFAQMPKIRIMIKYKNYKVFDGKKLLKSATIGLELNKNEMILKVPLQLLGNPAFVLASVKTFSGISAVDTVAFRKIQTERR